MKLLKQNTPKGLKLTIYDSTALEDKKLDTNDVLGYTWFYGTRIFKLINGLDISKDCSSWQEAFDWIESVCQDEVVDEVQFWGHGRSGIAAIGSEYLDLKELRARGEQISRIGKLLSPSALWWWRTCATYAGKEGKMFAAKFTELLGRRTAAYTFSIGFWQSGGRSLVPGQDPYWPDAEGYYKESQTMLSSGPLKPRTLLCLNNKFPKNW